MKILWITAQLPCLKSGSQVRQYQLIKHLCKSNKVIVLSLVKKSEENDVDQLQKLGAHVVAIPETKKKPIGKWSNRFRSWAQILFDPLPNFAHTFYLGHLTCHLHAVIGEYKPDLIHIEQLYVASQAWHLHNIPHVFTEENVESLNYSRQITQSISKLRLLAGRIEAQKLKAWETRMLKKFKTCIAVSENDAAELRKLSPATSVYVIPNGVDTDGFKPPVENKRFTRQLIYFGNLGYQPNIDALLYFSRDILPRIREQIPDAQLQIVGINGPPEIIILGKQPGIDYIGFVDDIRPYLWQATISVVPLRSGGGTRLKILESLAAGCPVVSTKIGSEGLDLTHGRNICIADTPEAFAKTVLDVLDNLELQHSLSDFGQKIVVEKYDWCTLGKQLEAVFHTTLLLKP